jgi:hypothetical protein
VWYSKANPFKGKVIGMTDNRGPQDNQGSADSTTQNAPNDPLVKSKEESVLKNLKSQNEQSNSENTFPPRLSLTDWLFIGRAKWKGWWKKWRGREKAKFTDKVIGWATVVIAFMAFLQWREMVGTGRQTDRIIDAANQIKSALITANQQNTDAVNRTLAESQAIADGNSKLANKSLTATINASKLDQRAWIVVKGIEGVPQLDQPWELHEWFTNTGKTPAKNVKLSCNIIPVANVDDITFKQLAALPEQPTLIAPNAQSYCLLQPMKVPKVTQDILDALKQKPLVSYGSVTYEDVFHGKHWLTYCEIMNTDGKSWNDCKSHNDTGDGEPPPN